MTGTIRRGSRHALTLSALVGIAAGCGGPDDGTSVVSPPIVAAPPPAADDLLEPEADRRKLMDELREVLVAFQNEHKRGPLKVTDLDKYRSKWPAACSAVGSGKIGVRWSRGIEPGLGGEDLLAARGGRPSPGA
jgi:hypothetical protein